MNRLVAARCPGGFDGGAAGIASFADLAACSARELPACRRGSADGLSDHLERQCEDVVKDECDALGRREVFKHHEQGQPHLVVERHPVCGIHGGRTGVAVAAGGHVRGAFARATART